MFGAETDEKEAAGAVTMEFIEKRRGPGEDRYRWKPFEPNPCFTTRWWDRPLYSVDAPWFIQVLHAGREVARVELDNTVHIGGYVEAPPLGPVALEIQFLEVSTECRRQGIATEVVTALSAAHPDRRLVAFSEHADEFWASLGWQRHESRKNPGRARPLFVQPAALWPI